MIFKHIKDIIQGKATIGKKRSSQWPRVRGEHLKTYPQCAVCGSKKKVEVHHKKPFHMHPELELEPSNLISLCESKKNGINCHLLVGHLGSYRDMNPDVELDSGTWSEKLSRRYLAKARQDLLEVLQKKIDAG